MSIQKGSFGHQFHICWQKHWSKTSVCLQNLTVKTNKKPNCHSQIKAFQVKSRMAKISKLMSEELISTKSLLF